MKKIINIISITTPMIVVIIMLMSYAGCSSNDEPLGNSIKNTVLISETAFELKINMRKLWEEHSFWTRNVILCLVDDLPGTEPAVQRLLQNQVDIGNAFKPYYGEEAGEKLTKLLYPHVVIGEEVIKAAKSGNTEVLEEANKRWYANADEICEFLSDANPNWELAPMKMMMHDHLKLTSDVVAQRVNKDYDADVVAHDQAREEILVMADMLSEGIIKQFQEKF